MPLINALKGALIGARTRYSYLSGSIFAVIVGLYEPHEGHRAVQTRLAPSNGFLWPIIGIGAHRCITRPLFYGYAIAYPLAAYSFFIGLVCVAARSFMAQA